MHVSPLGVDAFLLKYLVQYSVIAKNSQTAKTYNHLLQGTTILSRYFSTLFIMDNNLDSNRPSSNKSGANNGYDNRIHVQYNLQRLRCEWNKACTRWLGEVPASGIYIYLLNPEMPIKRLAGQTGISERKRKLTRLPSPKLSWMCWKIWGASTRQHLHRMV